MNTKLRAQTCLQGYLLAESGVPANTAWALVISPAIITVGCTHG
jgi:hypothetical protein